MVPDGEEGDAPALGSPGGQGAAEGIEPRDPGSTGHTPESTGVEQVLPFSGLRRLQRRVRPQPCVIPHLSSPTGGWGLGVRERSCVRLCLCARARVRVRVWMRNEGTGLSTSPPRNLLNRLSGLLVHASSDMGGLYWN